MGQSKRFGKKRSVAESVTVPLQCLLCLLAIIFPRSDSDIFSSSWQGIGFIEIFHVEARRFTPAHLLRGIIVAIKAENVVLPHHRFSILETPSVTGKQFVFSVGFVPIAHLYPAEVFNIFMLIDEEAVLLVDGKCSVCFEWQSLGLTLDGVLQVLVQRHSLFITLFSLRNERGDLGQGKVFDSRFRSLIVYTEAIFLCHYGQRAARENDC